MPDNDISTILRKMEEYHTGLSMRISQVEDKIAPITNVYTALQGFGSTVVWLGKWILTPFLLLVGVIISYKQIK